MRRALILLALLVGCSTAEVGQPAQQRLVFLRNAVLAPAGAGHAVGGERVLVERSWTPGQEVEVGGQRDRAPARPECVPLFHVELGDVSDLVALGASEPGTALAWSPDGARLAVGSYRGQVLVVDGWTGDVLARRALAETMIKRVAWAADGRTLYAAEQSPDAFVHALDADNLTSRWRVRLADDLGSSPVPPDTELHGVFTLPAAYELLVLGGGDLLVAGVHGWNDGDGRRLNRSRIYRLDPRGQVRYRWPAGATADATFLRVATDGEQVAVAVSRSADGPAPPGVPVGGVQVLRASDLAPLRSFVNEPLKPWFQRAFIWDALDIDGGVVMAGLGDGRVRIVPPSGEALTLEPGTPVLSGEIPISASVGWGLFAGDGLVFNTGATNIPWGSAVAATRPPAAHPGENTVWFHGLDGSLRWTWHGEHRIQGLSVSPDGRTLVVGAGNRTTDERRDLYGALVFRLGGEGSGRSRLVATCSTENPVFFRHAATDDGRVALAEVPYRVGEGEVRGSYRVTVTR